LVSVTTRWVARAVAASTGSSVDFAAAPNESAADLYCLSRRWDSALRR
jgi:hypothetical protein